MRQYADLDMNNLDSADPVAFLRLRGIVPANGNFTEEQLGRELHRYGWRWASTPDGVTAEKAYPRPGEFPDRIVSRNSDRVQAFVETLTQAIIKDESHGRWPAGPIQPDIVVQSPVGRTIALVEARGGTPFTPAEAEQYRISLWRSYVAYALSPYLLLTTGDVGFLWDQRDQQRSFYEQALSFSIAAVLTHYLPDWRSFTALNGSLVENIIARWLEDLARHTPTNSPPVPEDLADSPFLLAIEGAQVMLNQRW
jgi:hypothetical protein